MKYFNKKQDQEILKDNAKNSLEWLNKLKQFKNVITFLPESELMELELFLSVLDDDIYGLELKHSLENLQFKVESAITIIEDFLTTRHELERCYGDIKKPKL